MVKELGIDVAMIHPEYAKVCQKILVGGWTNPPEKY